VCCVTPPNLFGMAEHHSVLPARSPSSHTLRGASHDVVLLPGRMLSGSIVIQQATAGHIAICRAAFAEATEAGARGLGRGSRAAGCKAG